jgi:hypothetical protein
VRWSVVGPAVAVTAAVAVAAGVALSRSADDPVPDTVPPPVEVTSDAPRYGSLEELTAAADLVVRAEVVATERGRLFGSPGEGAVESRLVTLEIGSVLAGTPPAGPAVLVEEEGWLEDGTPVIVDGANPSTTGADGIWFLTAVGTADAPRFVVVSAQGRFLIGDAGRLEGAAGDDPLIAELTQLSARELTERITLLSRRAG